MLNVRIISIRTYIPFDNKFYLECINNTFWSQPQCPDSRLFLPSAKNIQERVNKPSFPQMFKIPAIAYFCIMIIVALTVNVLPYSYPAKISIGVLVMCPLGYEIFLLAIGKYPKVIKTLILLSLSVMFFLLIWTV